MPPLKLAVVGGGPSAFYVASRLVQLLPRTHPRADDLRIHIYDRLWAPYGLVRYGVAPDHPDVKNCTHKFAQTARDPRVRFFGNVDVGPAPPSPPHALPLPLPALLPHYTHLLLATGAPSPRPLPALPHALPALSLVHWYTLHPAAPPAPPLPAALTHLTLLGLGNVSLDIARLLLTHPTALAPRDVPASVLAALTRLWPTLAHVAIVGRGGPRAARWAPRELRELLSLPHARMAPLPPGILDDPAQPSTSRQEAKLLRLLAAGSTAPPPAPTVSKTLSLHFWRTPRGLAPDGQGGLLLEDTRTRSQSVLRTDLVVASLGFEGDGAPFAHADAGASNDAHAWFDAVAHRIRHADGRVLTPAGRVVRGVYVSGWAAQGARGVIAGTLLDAKAVAARIVGDWDAEAGAGAGGEGEAAPAEVLPRAVDMESVPREVESPEVMSWAQWEAVEQEERRRGEAAGKERERMAWADAREFLGL